MESIKVLKEGLDKFLEARQKAFVRQSLLKTAPFLVKFLKQWNANKKLYIVQDDPYTIGISVDKRNKGQDPATLTTAGVIFIQVDEDDGKIVISGDDGDEMMIDTGYFVAHDFRGMEEHLNNLYEQLFADVIHTPTSAPTRSSPSNPTTSAPTKQNGGFKKAFEVEVNGEDVQGEAEFIEEELNNNKIQAKVKADMDTLIVYLANLSQINKAKRVLRDNGHTI